MSNIVPTNELKGGFWADKGISISTKVKYEPTLSTSDIAIRVTYVAGCTGVGACIGAKLGAPAGGIGAGPGAGIGALGGLGFGLGTLKLYHMSKYYGWRHQLKSEGVQVFDSKFSGVEDFTCPITRSVPTYPVRLKGANEQVYEKMALLQAIRKYGKNPITREAVTVNDVVPAADVFAPIGKLCTIALKSKDSPFDDEEKKGLTILREECLSNAQEFYKDEASNLVKLVRGGDLLPRDFAKMAQDLAELMDPAVSV